MSAPPGEITRSLVAWEAGEAGAVDRLLPLVYQELKRLARRQLRRHDAGGATLDTTALVHETYLKFVDQDRVRAGGRSHFYAIAARAMRQVITDRARRHQATKRGEGARPETLHEDLPVAAAGAEIDTLLALDAALGELAAVNERCVRIVECRFFAGLTEEETAEALAVSVRTVQRDWLQARGWLRQHLSPDEVRRLSS